MVDPIKVEAKAVEEGVQARLLPNGSFTVRCMGSCKDEGRKSHTITVGAVSKPDAWHLHLTCDCPSGAARQREDVPCFHAATVARRLERMGWVEWSAGAWLVIGEGLGNLRVTPGGPVPALPSPIHSPVSVLIDGKRIQLDQTCPVCAPLGGEKPCSKCHKTGFVPTETGRAFIRLIKRHVVGS